MLSPSHSFFPSPRSPQAYIGQSLDFTITPPTGYYFTDASGVGVFSRQVTTTVAADSCSTQDITVTPGLDMCPAAIDPSDIEISCVDAPTEILFDTVINATKTVVVCDAEVLAYYGNDATKCPQSVDDFVFPGTYTVTYAVATAVGIDGVTRDQWRFGAAGSEANAINLPKTKTVTYSVDDCGVVTPPDAQSVVWVYVAPSSVVLAFPSCEADVVECIPVLNADVTLVGRSGDLDGTVIATRNTGAGGSVNFAGTPDPNPAIYLDPRIKYEIMYGEAVVQRLGDDVNNCLVGTRAGSCAVADFSCGGGAR